MVNPPRQQYDHSSVVVFFGGPEPKSEIAFGSSIGLNLFEMSFQLRSNENLVKFDQRGGLIDFYRACHRAYEFLEI